MKLKNKRTGEIATLTLSTNGEDMIIMGNDMLAHITKLSELNDYEDYEEPKEPKEYWFINSGGEVNSYYEEDEEPEDTKACKEIGNYFETEEEAEKAAGKLKAWKRLKDKGFRFEGWTIDDGIRVSVCTNFDGDSIYDEHRKEAKNDLDACFGGEG